MVDEEDGERLGKGRKIMSEDMLGERTEGKAVRRWLWGRS